MSDSTFPMEISKNDSANAVANAIHVTLSDGAADLAKAADAAYTGGDFGIMGLAVRNDAGTSLVGTDGDYSPLSVDATGALRVTTATTGLVDDSAFGIATDKVTPAGFLADETAPDSVNEGDIGAARMTLDRKLLVRIVGSVDTQRLEINALGGAKVDLSQVNGVAHGPANPVYVYQVGDDGAASTEVHSNVDDVVAGGGTTNQDYTVAGSYFMLKGVQCASSAGSKFEVFTGPVASLVSKAVAFLPKGMGGAHKIDFAPWVKVPVASTGTVRVAKTNLQSTSNSIYASIMGNDYA